MDISEEQAMIVLRLLAFADTINRLDDESIAQVMSGFVEVHSQRQTTNGHSLTLASLPVGLWCTYEID